MRRHGVTPVPRHFELWVADASGGSSKLARRMDAMLARGEAFTTGALYGEFVAPDPDAMEAADEARPIQNIAAALVVQVVGNQHGVHAYRQALVRWAERLRSRAA